MLRVRAGLACLIKRCRQLAQRSALSGRVNNVMQHKSLPLDREGAGHAEFPDPPLAPKRGDGQNEPGAAK